MKSRRQFVKNTTAGLGLISLSSLPYTQATENIEKKKIVCVGGHPDDPESGCGGTLAKLNKNGHAITIIYLTIGEAGIEGKSHAEASSIRKQEAVNACAVLNAKPVFAGQIDGDTIINNTWVSKSKN
ncbi:MAG: PIG-L family deacetylase [Segetibacter sp.]